MKYWFDTEFIEDGKTIDLISIGIVSQDGREYYAENTDCDSSLASQWVKDNVFPYLSNDFRVKKSKAVIAKEIIEFVGEEPEFWAYYADYDWVALCQLYGRMIDLPPTWPMFCLDVQQISYLKGVGKIDWIKNDQIHNALSDAKWTKEIWRVCDEWGEK